MNATKAAIDFLIYDDPVPPLEGSPHRLKVGDQLLTRTQVAALLRDECDKFQATERRNTQIYAERNALAIAFARCAAALGWTTGCGRDSDTTRDWQEDWRTVVYVDMPNGQQVSWHMAPEQADEAKRLLPIFPGVWDGTFVGRDVEQFLRILPDMGESINLVARDAQTAFYTPDAAKQVTMTGREYIDKLMPLIDAAPDTARSELLETQAIDALIAVARAAHTMADNCDESGPVHHPKVVVQGADLRALSDALDTLDELPEPGANIVGTGPAKAEHALRFISDDINAARNVLRQVADGELVRPVGIDDVTDAKINEITMDTLGKWPSFEAQSWACKVSHSVLKLVRAQPQAPASTSAMPFTANEITFMQESADAVKVAKDYNDLQVTQLDSVDLDSSLAMARYEQLNAYHTLLRCSDDHGEGLQEYIKHMTQRHVEECLVNDRKDGEFPNEVQYFLDLMKLVAPYTYVPFKLEGSEVDKTEQQLLDEMEADSSHDMDDIF